MRIGLIGCGRWGRNILRDLRLLECDVFVFARGDESRRSAQKGGAAAVHADMDDFADVDGWVIAAPSARHYEWLNQLIPTGKPIFCEKPLTIDAEQAREIAARAPRQVFVMDKWRYHPGIEAIAAVERAGELGALRQVRTKRLQWALPRDDADAVWDLLPHDLAIATEIIGDLPKPAAARGLWTGERMEGVVGMLGEDPSAVVDVSMRWPVMDRHIAAVFDDGLAVLHEALGDHILVYRGGGEIGPPRTRDDAERRSVSAEFPLLRELRAFVQHIGGGPPPKSDAVFGARVIETIAELRGLAMAARG